MGAKHEDRPQRAVPRCIGIALPTYINETCRTECRVAQTCCTTHLTIRCCEEATRKISETYFGKRKRYWTTRIWSPYFERDYIRGITTDMVPACRFEDHEFAMRFPARWIVNILDRTNADERTKRYRRDRRLESLTRKETP